MCGWPLAHADSRGDCIARRSKASSRAICVPQLSTWDLRLTPPKRGPLTYKVRVQYMTCRNTRTHAPYVSPAGPKLVILMPTLRTLFALACLCSAAHAFVAAPPAALALRSSAAVHSSPIVSASTPSRSTDLVLSETKAASPIAAVCAGGLGGHRVRCVLHLHRFTAHWAGCGRRHDPPHGPRSIYL